MTEAEAYFTTFFEALHGVQDFALVEALRVTEKSWVFSAVVNGEQVVLKRFLRGNSAKTVRRMQEELNYLETVFDDNRFQANRCLFGWPESGVVVLSFTPGNRLGNEIAQSSGAERSALLTQSGEWLRQYCAPRRREVSFGPFFWVKQLAGLKLDQISLDSDKALLETLLKLLRKQVQTVKGTPVVQAATHGDFVGMNLHYHEGTIYGVDIQGESWMAIAKEAARFLVWLQIHEDDRPNERWCGIGAEDVGAFLASAVLKPEEHRTTLPFFIGEQLYIRFVENYRRRRIRDNARAAIEAYLQDK